ncbi:MAG TPA: hypothetical protein VMF09_07890 [Solirubrobacteraceae bacterium]|nr:hypothetical protein [Solirubrobacteraceae bacterium]
MAQARDARISAVSEVGFGATVNVRAAAGMVALKQDALTAPPVHCYLLFWA